MSSSIRTRTFGSILLLAALAGGALPACSWTRFDDLADETWVDVVGNPSESNSWGNEGVVGDARRLGPGATLIAFGRNGEETLTKVTYDADGVATVGAPKVLAVEGIAGVDAHTPFVIDPETGNVVLGLMLGGGAPSFAVPVFSPDLTPEPVIKALPSTVLTSAERPVSLSFGHANNEGGGPEMDLLMARQDNLGGEGQIVLFNNYVTVAGRSNPGGDADSWAAMCRVGAPIKSALLADIDPSREGDEIIAAIGGGTTQGQIIILTGARVTRASTLAAIQPCLEGDPIGDPLPPPDPIVFLTSPQAEPDLGTAMVTGDFDGDGALDLAVSAPSSNQVYVFPSGTGTPLMIPGEDDARLMGTALAAGNLDTDAADELIVGSPAALVGGVDAAGAAYIYDHVDTGFVLQATLHDASPANQQRFGDTVSIVPFGTAGENVVVIGAVDEVFTYFRTTVYDDTRAGR